MKLKAYRIICLIMLSIIIASVASKNAQAWYKPPKVQIISPESKIYAADSVPLIFTLSGSASWIGYSLDGQENVTIAGNVTLTDLADEPHDVVVYARDICDFVGVSNKVYFGVDTMPPNITNVSQIPGADSVYEEDIVKVNATVTDNFSGVKQVILNYTNGNGTWVTVNMTKIGENIWNGTIPAFEYCTWVNYTIMAEDNVGHRITTVEVYGYQYQYHVIPELPSIFILLILATATTLAALFYRRHRR
ncbi:hypothetical protein HXY32_00145 [Candidatus Bathyarchaeota archaeon]|nr:hypothetical protein [Candidatus Bathyarchaeota archaeon]